jgi:hypothetical protein
LAPWPEPQPRDLNRVVRLGEPSKQAVGDGSQADAMRLEALGQPFVFIHLSHSLVAACQSSDPAKIHAM